MKAHHLDVEKVSQGGRGRVNGSESKRSGIEAHGGSRWNQRVGQHREAAGQSEDDLIVVGQVGCRTILVASEEVILMKKQDDTRVHQQKVVPQGV